MVTVGNSEVWVYFLPLAIIYAIRYKSKLKSTLSLVGIYKLRVVPGNLIEGSRVLLLNNSLDLSLKPPFE